jgi:hypothetical protein
VLSARRREPAPQPGGRGAAAAVAEACRAARGWGACRGCSRGPAGPCKRALLERQLLFEPAEAAAPLPGAGPRRARSPAAAWLAAARRMGHWGSGESSGDVLPGSTWPAEQWGAGAERRPVLLLWTRGD